MPRRICGRRNPTDWKWVPGRKPQLPEPFTIEKLVPLMDEAGVDRVVIVPPSWPGDRNDYAPRSRQALSEPFRRHGPHPAGEAGIGGAAAEMEGAAGHERRPADLHARAGRDADQGTPTGSGPPPRRPACRSCSSRPDNMPKFAPIAERHPGLHADHRPHEPHCRRSRKERPHRARPSTRWSRSRNIRTSRSSCRRRRTFR